MRIPNNGFTEKVTTVMLYRTASSFCLAGSLLVDDSTGDVRLQSEGHLVSMKTRDKTVSSLVCQCSESDLPQVPLRIEP